MFELTIFLPPPTPPEETGDEPSLFILKEQASNWTDLRFDTFISYDGDYECEVSTHWRNQPSPYPCLLFM